MFCKRYYAQRIAELKQKNLTLQMKLEHTKNKRSESAFIETFREVAMPDKKVVNVGKEMLSY